MCVWFDGPHKGDFLVSIGGYSPFVPKKKHYPDLDRLSLTWAPEPGMLLHGEMYFALDRYSLALGCAARLEYEKGVLTAKAWFSFDALIQWTPIFFEVRLRIGIHVEIRTFITIRLGLDVDMHAWGPPFGAKVTVKVTFLFASLSYTVDVGTSLKDARPVASFDEVLTVALGGRPSMLQIASAGAPPGQPAQSPAGTKDPAATGQGAAKDAKAEVPRLRGDEVHLQVAMAVPATKLSNGGKDVAHVDDGLDVRPMRIRGIQSALDLKVGREDGKPLADADLWRLEPDLGAPTEALWYYPDGSSEDDQKRKLLESSGRKAINGVSLRPPARARGVQLSVSTAPIVEHFTLHTAGAAAATLPAIPRDALAAAHFDLAECE